MRRYTETNSNAYVELKVMHSSNEVQTLVGNHSFLHTNQESKLEDFLCALDGYEAGIRASKGIDIDMRYGVVLTFLLDKEYGNDTLVALSKNLMSYYKDLPAYAYVYKLGKGNYLEIYFSERYYYPAGKKVKIFANCDRYQNKKTGKICKSTDEDAVLIKKKGAFIRTDTITFSKKVRFFKFQSPKAFEAAMNKLKNDFMDMLEECCGAEIEYGVSFKRIVKRGYIGAERKKIEVWNNTFARMETVFNDAIKVLKELDCYEKSEKKKVFSFFFKYYQRIYRKKFKYLDRFFIEINPIKKKYRNCVEDAQSLFSMFTDDLNNMMSSLIPVC